MSPVSRDKSSRALAASSQAAEESLTLDRTLRALLALQVADREDRLNTDSPPRKTEFVLVEAGLTLGEVARLTGKPYETVKGTVRRARQRSASRSPRPGEESAVTEEDA